MKQLIFRITKGKIYLNLEDDRIWLYPETLVKLGIDINNKEQLVNYIKTCILEDIQDYVDSEVNIKIEDYELIEEEILDV